MLKKLSIRDFEVTINTKPDGYYDIVKIEIYSADTSQYIDITNIPNQKINDFLREKINDKIAEENDNAA